MPNAVKSICIVGAGFAGLSTARVMKALGYRVTVFEKEPDVGGVWAASRRYPGLTTQNPRSTYALSEFPMPDHYPEWPTGEQVQSYMQDYADTFDLSRDIELSTEVTWATFDAPDERWEVSVRRSADDAEAPRTLYFDYLVVANGIFSVPSVPVYEGADEFLGAGGRILHTSECNDAAAAEGRHVLVIGYGKSSCDVANAIAEHAASTTVVARHLIWKLPRRLMGVLNYKHLFLTRFSESLFRYIRLEGIERFLHGVGDPLRRGILGSMQWVIQRQLRLDELGLHPRKPLETIARSTVSLATEGFYEKIRTGEIAIRKNAEIERLAPGEATLSTGEAISADMVVCGTGWRQVCPFLDPAIMAKVTDEEGNFRLYKSILPVGVPRLAFSGYNSSFFSQLNCEIGALWLADYLQGGFSLPSLEEQSKWADERIAWMRARTDGKHSKGTNIIPFSIHHMDELLRDMDMNVGPWTRFKQWFSALDPADYRHLLGRLKAKHGLADTGAARLSQQAIP